MNILITSAGRRIKIVEYFKAELKEFDGKVIAVDCDATAPALYFADHSEVVPRIHHPTYIKTIRDICLQYNVRGIVSLIDPELTLLSQHVDDFKAIDVDIIISDPQTVQFCFDKFETFQQLSQHHVPVIPTFLEYDDVLTELEKKSIVFPLVVKPRTGSASIGVQIVQSLSELHTILTNQTDVVIQPFIHGQEYGVDAYVDLISRENVAIFIKQKLKMRAGETDKSIAVHDPDILNVVRSLLQVKPFIGPVDIDCFKTETGVLISEINPRFGGGYPHAHEAGINFVKMIVQNLRGIENKPVIHSYPAGTTMIKYDQVLFMDNNPGCE